MTPNEIKRLETLHTNVKKHVNVSGRVTLTDANVRLIRKATQDAIRQGNACPEMLSLAKKMGFL